MDSLLRHWNRHIGEEGNLSSTGSPNSLNIVDYNPHDGILQATTCHLPRSKNIPPITKAQAEALDALHILGQT